MSATAIPNSSHLLSVAVQNISTAHLLLQMVVALAIVLGAVWALAKLAKRTRRFADGAPAAGSGMSRHLRSGGRALWRGARSQLRGQPVAPTRGRRTPAHRRRGAPAGVEVTIASRKPLGRGKSIAVVDVGTRRFLVGISESGFTQLGEVPREELAMETRSTPLPARLEVAPASAPAHARGGALAPAFETNEPTASVTAWLEALRGGSVAH